jgi:60 kDa SS-A/Ro ribonucleoprotein
MSHASKLFTAPVVVTNHEGYPAFTASDEQRYVQTLLTNTLGNTFYVSQKDLLEESKMHHARMVAVAPEFVAKALVYARNKGYMRTQPVYGLACLVAYKGDAKEVERRRKIAASIFGEIIQTPNDLYDFVTLAGTLGCKLNSRGLKKMVTTWLNAKMNEYWAIKYGANKEEVSLRKVLRHFHPAHTELYRYMRAKKGGFEANLAELPKIRAFEALKVASTDAEKVKAIQEGGLPHEVATAFAGTSTDVWNAIVPNLPIFALLKNLATLERHGVLEANRARIEGMLTSEVQIAKSKIFPYRYAKAMEHVQASWLQDALRVAVEKSFVNVPPLAGKTVVFLDVSGSMEGDRIKQSSLFAMSVMKQAADSRLFLFSMGTQEFKFSRIDSLLTQANSITANGGTDTSSPLRKLLAEKCNVDNIVLITDEQQNQGAPFNQVLEQYRRSVNAEVKLFIINVAPGTTHPCVAAHPLTHHIFGWSDQVLSFISLATQGWASVADMFLKEPCLSSAPCNEKPKEVLEPA